MIPDISPLTAANLLFVFELASLEKWGHLPDDFARFRNLDPNGSFVARFEHAIIGMITTISYGDYAFMGNLIVKRENRGQGIGHALMKHAIAYLDNKGVKTIELDGVFSAVSMYREFGFVDKYLSLRFYRRAGLSNNINIGDDVIKGTREDIISYDWKKTEINRGNILSKFLEENNESIYRLEEGKITGYALIRKRAGDTTLIAPVVADNYESARFLLGKIVSEHSARVLTIGIVGNNLRGVELVRSFDFNYMPPSLRMYRGPIRNYENNVFGILGPDIG
jgi:GNAT superfamily N-acetyltransferase